MRKFTQAAAALVMLAACAAPVRAQSAYYGLTYDTTAGTSSLRVSGGFGVASDITAPYTYYLHAKRGVGVLISTSLYVSGPVTVSASSVTILGGGGLGATYGISVGSITINRPFTIAAAVLTSPVDVISTATSFGAASVHAGMMANVLVTDTANHASDASHAIGVLGIATTTANSRITVIGVEGRINLQDVSTTATGTVVQIGVLGYANSYGNITRSDNNFIVGVEARARKTALSDGGGAIASTGTVIGLYVGSIVGGATNYGIFVASGTYNYLSGNVGIGAGNNLAPVALSVYGIIASSTTSPSSLTCNAGTPAWGATSTNQTGEFTVGIGSVFCTITWSVPYRLRPNCWCNNKTTTMAMRAAEGTTNLLCIGAAPFTTGDVIGYGCDAVP